MENKIRIEYSEIEGQFLVSADWEDYDSTDTNGFNTLSASMNSERGEHFILATTEKFPGINSIDTKNFPTFLVIKNEYKKFIEAEINAIKESMNKTYIRRNRIFTDSDPL